MNEKPYVPIRGIPKPTVAYKTSHGQALITNLYPALIADRNKGGTKKVYNCVIANKPQVRYISIDDKPDLEAMLEAARAKYVADFEARYPGIYDLVSAIEAREDYHAAVEDMMDDEYNDGVNPPQKPTLSVNDARKKYPIASAYLNILYYADSDPSSDIGYRRRCWGKDALDAICQGADVIEQAARIKRKAGSYISTTN